MRKFKQEGARLRWKRIIEEQQESGLPIKEYCRQNSLNLTCFHRAKTGLQRWYKENPLVEFSWPLCSPDQTMLNVIIEYDGMSFQTGPVSPHELRDYLQVIRGERR